MDDLSRFRVIRYTVGREELLVESKALRSMAQTAVMLEPSSVIDLCIVLPTMPKLVRLSRRQTLRDPHEPAMQDPQYGEMSPIFRTNHEVS